MEKTSDRACESESNRFSALAATVVEVDMGASVLPAPEIAIGHSNLGWLVFLRSPREVPNESREGRNSDSPGR